MRIKMTLACLLALMFAACGEKPDAAVPEAEVEEVVEARSDEGEQVRVTPRAVSASKGPTVADVYPVLPTGVLVHARLGELPKGVLVRSGEVEVTADAIAAIVADQPEEYREELAREEFFLLEQEVEHKLMVAFGTRMLEATGGLPEEQPERAALMTFVHKIAEGVSVSNEEIQSFFSANQDSFGGATFEQVRDPIEHHLLGEKQMTAISERIRNFGLETDIVVSSSYAEKAALRSGENPVGAARLSGRPSMIVFGGTDCCGEDFARPLVERMSPAYGGRLSMVPLDTQENQVLAAKCGVRAIPTIIFYGADGVERERLSGHVEDEEIEAALEKIGVR